MSDSTCAVRRAWPRPAGTSAAAFAATVLALLAVACGGSNSPGATGRGSPGNSAVTSAVAYSACMRSHGVPNYPDPGSDGNLPKGNAQAFGVSDSQYQTAERACRHRLRGARAATAGPPQLPAPLTVRRRISIRGAIMIGGQRIQVGLPHAGKTAEITIESDTYQITVEDGITLTASRTTSRDIKRHMAFRYLDRGGHDGQR